MIHKYFIFFTISITFLFLSSNCLTILYYNGDNDGTNPSKKKVYSSLLALLGNPTSPTSPTNPASNNTISISAPSLGYTLKNGGTDTIQVKLTSKPSSNVTIPVAVSDALQAMVSPSSLTFTSENWDTLQTVTLMGIDDLSHGITTSYNVNFGPSVSTDSYANNLSGSSTLSNRDFRKLIFVSTTVGDGNLGGIAGADSICNADGAKPANTGSYKAMIVLPGVRVASVTPNAGDGQIDWVLLPNQLYTRPDGTVIMITDSASIFVFGLLTNSIGTNANAIRTGLNNSNDWRGSGGCGNWLDNGAWGPYATENAVNTWAINSGNLHCGNPSNLFCVQQ